MNRSASGWVESNLLYDGVETHGWLHRYRMESVFWARTRIMTNIVKIFIAALPPPENSGHQKAIRQAFYELIDLCFPGSKKEREKRDQFAKEFLGRQEPLAVVGLDEDDSIDISESWTRR